MVKALRQFAGGLAVFALLFPIAAPVATQTIDPRVLEKVQSQLGSPMNQGNPMDQARSADESGLGLPTNIDPTRIDTREEQQLRREQARVGLARLYRPSPIEREFRERLADPTLRQFGYDLFEAARGTSGALTGAVDDSYVVGVGDSIVVQFQGATNDSQTVRVARDGSIVVGALPPIPAAGRSLASVRRDLQAATRRTMLGTEVFISLGAVRAVTVFVGGEVVQPGQYSLTSLSDISSALAQAGGVRRSGSLRNVRVVRGGRTLTVDLYGLLGIGEPPSLRLADGDRVIVPVIGDTVAIAGSVARPGIYEMRRGSSLGALLAYAGGALRPRGNQIAISRITVDGSEEYIRAPTLASLLVPGDAVQVSGGSAGGSTGRVVLRGYVSNPGARALAAAPTVRDLLGDISNLKSGTYMPMAVLIRRDPATAARSFEPVNLLTALNGRPGVALRSDDRLYVFSRDDVDFLNRSAVRRIVLGQANTERDCLALDRLEALVRDSQTLRFNVVTRSAFIVERRGRSDIAATGGTIGTASRAGDEALRTGDDLLGLPEQTPPPVTTQQLTMQQQQQQQLQQQQLRTREAQALQANNLKLLDPREQERRCPAVFEEEPELLPVLIEYAVGVGGAVRRPGAYPIAGNITAAELAGAAEGVLSSSSGMTLDISRVVGGTVTEERIEVDGYPQALTQTVLRSGDDIRFNAAQPQFETGGVLLSGEFNRPGLYSIRKGETLSQLIARAGGLTPLAYPYGAIFTRRSVKELEQEGLRRTARELTTALLAVSARKSTTGDALLAGQSLISQLATVEAPGRVVVEADPRVLAMRPDLDTVLDSGDAIVMPKRPNFVLALGDVSNPGALQFVAGKSVGAYVSETGGTQSTADRKRIFVVLPNGTSQPVSNRGWGSSPNIVVPPGSTIIVPKNIDPLRNLDLARDITSIIGSLLTSVATIAILANQN